MRKLLRAWLADHGMSVDAFAVVAGIDRATVYSYLSERSKRRPSIDSAVAIERATQGAVPASSWANEKQTESEQPMGRCVADGQSPQA